jgi:hypothetical protein
MAGIIGVNGPIRDENGMNCGTNAMGPGARIDAWRAELLLRLILCERSIVI